VSNKGTTVVGTQLKISLQMNLDQISHPRDQYFWPVLAGHSM